MNRTHGPSRDSIEAGVEELIQLLRDMQNLCENWPQRDPVVLRQCEEEARRREESPQKQGSGLESLQQLMKQEGRPHPPFSSFRPRGTPIRLSYRDIGSLDYDKADPEYRKRVERTEKAVIDLAKQVDHAVYLLRDLLLKWPRVRGTLLTADWRALRDKTPSNLVFAIREYYDRGELAATLDDLDLYLKERQSHKPDSEPNGPGPASGQNRKITLAEANAEVGRLLKENPTWDWHVKTLTAKVKERLGGGSQGLIGKCPIWKVYNGRRDALRKKGTIKTVSLTSKMEAVLGVDGESLPELIAEQEAEDRDDTRKAKLYLSHEKKPRRRES